MGIYELAPEIDLTEGLRLGEVTGVEADALEIELVDPAVAPRVTVSDIVAFPVAGGFMIGIVAALSRRVAATLMTVMPVGSLHGDTGRGTAFRLGASRHPHVGAACHLVEGEALRSFMSALGNDVLEDEQLALGHYVADDRTRAIADGNRLLQRHLSVLGNTGAGKSWTVALLLERASQLRHANIVVLDLHGEYAPLCEPGVGREPIARRLRVAGPADMLYADDEALHIPYWLLQRDELLSLVLNENDRHAADQRLALADRVQTLKRSKLTELGHHDAVATATVDSPVPFQLSHLTEWLARDEVDTIIRQPSGRVDPGPFHGKLGGLISRLEARIADPRYGFIFNPPEETESGDWLVEMATKLMATEDFGIKVIDMSEVPNTILPMVAGVLARLIYNVQFWKAPDTRTPICLVCDEAHLYLPSVERPSAVHRVALDAFEMIAKEGRKYGVCLAVVSQRPSDVNRTILSQCNNFIVMRLTNDQDQEVIGHVVPGALAGVRDLLPMLDVGEAVVIGDALLMPIRIKLDAPAVAPTSATLPYWTMWASEPATGESIATGVDALRNQWRGAD